MSMPPLSQADLKSFQNQLQNRAYPRQDALTSLRELYARFHFNEQNLINLEYSISINAMEKQYKIEKEQLQNALSELKTQYKQVDNRIASLEQKLSRGIPEDLSLMNKVIAEQEAIIVEQEKLNAQEAVLMNQMSDIDVSYGKTKEKLEQNRVSKFTPLAPLYEAYNHGLIIIEKKISKMVNILALIPLILIPVIIEIIAGLAGLPLTLSTNKSHFAFTHYLFLIALVVSEYYLAEPVRAQIYSRLVLQKVTVQSEQLQDMLDENLRSISQLEAKSNVKLSQVL